jgi:uncharacterized protein (TIGR02284 family)
LNRLIVAGRDEGVALEGAARIADGSERRTRLRAQARRRAVFRRDLVAAVTALGGVPAKNASSAAKLAEGARRARAVLIGPHEGDAYAVCAGATEKTATAYAKALRLSLPTDVRFGVQRQFVEVEWDRRELRRLRWGASPTPLPAEGDATSTERPETGVRREVEDERALTAWSEDGGAAHDDHRQHAGAMH